MGWLPSAVAVSSAVASGAGLVFNGYILVVLLWQRQLKTANTLLLLHLAFVDSLFCLTVISSSTFTSSQHRFAELSGPQRAVCAAHGFVWTLLPVVLVWTVCALSADRYAAIAAPLHYSRLVNTRRAGLFLGSAWVLATALAVPPLLGVCPYGYRPERAACGPTCSLGTVLPNSSEVVRFRCRELEYALSYVGLAVVLPLVIILLCNLHILLIARYHRHRIVAAIYEVTLSAQATVTHQRHPCYLSKFKGRNALLTISQLVGSLLLLSVPYCSVLVWEAWRGAPAHPLWTGTSVVLLACTPPVNAYVYGVKSRVLRKAFKRLLQRHLDKQKARREVDRRLSLVNGEGARSRRVSQATLYRRTSEPPSLHDVCLGGTPPPPQVMGAPLQREDHCTSAVITGVVIVPDSESLKYIDDQLRRTKVGEGPAPPVNGVIQHGGLDI